MSSSVTEGEADAIPCKNDQCTGDDWVTYLTFPNTTLTNEIFAHLIGVIGPNLSITLPGYKVESMQYAPVDCTMKVILGPNLSNARFRILSNSILPSYPIQQIEYEFLRYEFQAAPNFMSDEMWERVLNEKTEANRRRLYKFFFLKEDFKRKKVRKQAEGAKFRSLKKSQGTRGFGVGFGVLECPEWYSVDERTESAPKATVLFLTDALM